MGIAGCLHRHSAFLMLRFFPNSMRLSSSMLLLLMSQVLQKAKIQLEHLRLCDPQCSRLKSYPIFQLFSLNSWVRWFFLLDEHSKKIERCRRCSGGS